MHLKVAKQFHRLLIQINFLASQAILYKLPTTSRTRAPHTILILIKATARPNRSLFLVKFDAYRPKPIKNFSSANKPRERGRTELRISSSKLGNRILESGLQKRKELPLRLNLGHFPNVGNLNYLVNTYTHTHTHMRALARSHYIIH